MVNHENYSLFYNPDEADNWVWRIENCVGDWIGNKNKSFWYVVQWESQREGILKESVTQMQFAQLLVQECPDALSKGDTPVKIVANMGKFKFKDNLRNFDSCPTRNNVRKYVDAVSDLLTCDVQKEEPDNHFTWLC